MLPAMTDPIAAAQALATRAHAGQVRDGGAPYISHPARVAARLARRFPEDAALVAAGWCHDVLEDCPAITAAGLAEAVGTDAAALVREVTNPSASRRDLPRAERKAMDRAHLAHISRRARCLKLVDRADNLREGMATAERAWLARYAGESRLLAAALAGTDAELEAELAAAIAAAAAAGELAPT